jgi:hypothetical protein
MADPNNTRPLVGVPYSESSTSLEAAQTLDLDKAALDRVRINRFIRSRGMYGAIDEETSLELGLDLNSVRPRRQELEKAGYIGKSGYRRKTKKGKNANIWVSLREDEIGEERIAPRQGKSRVIDLSQGQSPVVEIGIGVLKLRVTLEHVSTLERASRSQDPKLADALAKVIGEVRRSAPPIAPRAVLVAEKPEEVEVNPLNFLLSLKGLK